MLKSVAPSVGAPSEGALLEPDSFGELESPSDKTLVASIMGVVLSPEPLASWQPSGHGGASVGGSSPRRVVHAGPLAKDSAADETMSARRRRRVDNRCTHASSSASARGLDGKDRAPEQLMSIGTRPDR